jgi:thiamine pyrophosphokinase
MKIIDPYKYPKAVIIGNGDFPSTRIPIEVLDNAETIVVCDGAANQYIPTGRPFDLIIGDGDSISSANRTRFADIIRYNPDQQTNDQTKAVQFLLSQGKRRIAIVAATGKREDHTLGNIALLAEYLDWGADVRSYTDYGVFIPCRDTITLEVRQGAQVSIFNIDAVGFTSQNLAYPLYDFTALWQGTLNEATAEQITISAAGRYIVYVTYR